ncbi:hypothetical protein N802_18755 [Knoellia sinensis KCTC 19936]|uniref:Uncharacterized protein n=1 Tax=Knoellia sinensis KCTC 19936 TaxID=1385520 RepID=A0A0A0J8N2_9MICO|nr:hypothetical protein [Knoellia sinensis]KGN32407.1 hypothetical protein N802_18755 [Knoellia sinensis KCTC 19936]
MRVMIIDSGRGHHAGLVDSLRDELGLDPLDEVVWVARELPKEPLPVVAHLVTRPRMGVLQRTLRIETLLDGPDAQVDVDAATLRRVARRDDDDDAEAKDIDASEDELGVPTEQLEEQLPESMQEHEHHDATPGASPEAVPASVAPASTPLPERVVAAARWRSNAVRLKARDTYRRGKASAKRRINSSEVTPVVVTRDAIKKVLPNVGTKFGYTTATSRNAIELAATCDVVFSHDARSHKAAWLLAQRTPHPDVVVGINAARRAVAGRRAVSARD